MFREIVEGILKRWTIQSDDDEEDDDAQITTGMLFIYRISDFLVGLWNNEYIIAGKTKMNIELLD